jgi:riboflavin synthase alpha subunit
LDVTTLGDLERGREVNVEVDVIAKYVERLGESAQARED